MVSVNAGKSIFFASVVIIATVLALVVSQQETIERYMRAYKLLPEPEPFTELYFNNHLDLPTVFVDSEPATFSFTIRNLEHKQMEYEYSVTAIATDESYLKPIKAGRVWLTHDQLEAIDVEYTIATTEPRMKVQVLLENINQSIHFWLNPQQ